MKGYRLISRGHRIVDKVRAFQHQKQNRFTTEDAEVVLVLVSLESDIHLSSFCEVGSTCRRSSAV